MDSGNSGSLQSSSGGDDDFESRGGGVDSSPLSALLRPAPSPSAAGPFSLHHGSLYGLQDFTSGPPQHHQQHQQQQTSWLAAQFMAPGAASSSQRVAAAADAGMGGGASAHQASDPSSAGAAAPAPAPPRGSRKRARASRRPPTTVLTTDTSNFRAMVQEFTGIANPPFAAGAVGGPGASFNSRFDHIFSSSALRSAADTASSLPPYLLRPFAQKLQTAPFAPFTSPSSSTPASANVGGPNANVNATAAAATTAAASANQRADDFQQPSSALLRMQQDQQSSSYLSFQNLLGSTQPPLSQHMFGGRSHGAPRLHEQSPSQLLSSGGIGLTHGGMMVSEGMQHMHQQRNDVHQGGGDELSGVVRAGASGSGGSGSCKLNYTSHAGASSSSAAGSTADAPAPDGASRPSRGEGLDPWLCTSE